MIAIGIRLVDHKGRELGKRKDNAFVFDPLLTQDDCDAKTGDEEGKEEGKPPEDRARPDVPGQSLMGGQTFPEVGDVIPTIIGDGPGPDVFVGKFCPAIFGCSFVIGAGQDGDQTTGDVFGGEGTADEAHAKYKPQFLGA